MKYPKKKGAWHIIERFGAGTTVCGMEIAQEVRAVPYDWFPHTLEKGVCQDCLDHEDLPLIVLRDRA